ncbi:MAG: sigma-54-dependent Fis family transcriptional regulator, partial [Marinomonas sp.]
MLDNKQVILIDDEQAVRMAISQTLQLEDFEVAEFSSAQGVVERLSLDFSGVIVSDINLPGKSGLALFDDVKKIDAEIPFIVITGHGDISMAVNAIRDGAYDFIEKPFSNEDFIEVVRRATEKRRLTLENRSLRLELVAQNAPGTRIIGN